MFLDSKQFLYNYDLDSLSYKYGRIGGASGLGCPGKYGAKTTGSSVTINAAAGTPFDPVNVGDLIVFFIPPDTKSLRKIATKVSGAQITVDTAIDLGTVGVPFDFYPFRIGSAAGDGWHAVQAYSSMTVWVSIAAVAAAGGVDLTIEGLSPNLGGLTPVTLLPTKNYSVAGTEAINIGEVVQAIRVGVKGATGFAGTDSISVWMTGEVRKAGY